MRPQDKQEAAQPLADRAQTMARNSLEQGLDTVNTYIQAGPVGVSVLCFFVGLATVIYASFKLVAGLMTLEVVSDPFMFVLDMYLVGGGLVSVVLESDAEKIDTIPVLGAFSTNIYAAQKWLFENAKFLTSLRGRGGFYIFIGTLAATQCMFCLFFPIGVALIALGVVLILLSLGVKPDVSYANVSKQLANTDDAKPVPLA